MSGIHTQPGAGGGGRGSDVDEKKIITALEKELSDIDTKIPTLEAALAEHEKDKEGYESLITHNPSWAHLLHPLLDTLRDVTIPVANAKLTAQRQLRQSKAKELDNAKAALKKAEDDKAAKDDKKKRRPSRDLSNPPKRTSTGIDSQKAMKHMSALDPIGYKESMVLGIHYIEVDGASLERTGASFRNKLKACGYTSHPPPTAARDIAKVKAFLQPLADSLPGQLGNLVSQAPNDETGDPYQDYLTYMVEIVAKLHRDVMSAVREICDDIESVTCDQTHSTSLDMFPAVKSLIERYGYKGFMNAAADQHKLTPIGLKQDVSALYVGELLAGEWESEHGGIQYCMWGEVTKTVLVALRVCFAMSLLTRSLLITEDRVVDIPSEKRTIWTGVGLLQNMLDQFGVMCTKATDFVKDSQTGVVVYKFPEELLDDPFIKDLLAPAIAELAPDPSAGPAFTAAQLLNPKDHSWEEVVHAAHTSSFSV